MNRTFPILLILASITVTSAAHCSEAVANPVDARPYLLEKAEVSDLKLDFPRPSKWTVPAVGQGKDAVIQGIAQRMVREDDRSELVIEVAVVPDKQEALRAAEYRVKKLTAAGKLVEQRFRGDSLPEQAREDRIWALIDPPEPGQEPNPVNRIGPVSTLAVVIFTCRDTAVQVSAHNMTTGVSLDDAEPIARKMSAKIKKVAEEAAKGPKTGEESGSGDNESN